MTSFFTNFDQISHIVLVIPLLIFITITSGVVVDPTKPFRVNWKPQYLK